MLDRPSRGTLYTLLAAVVGSGLLAMAAGHAPRALRFKDGIPTPHIGPENAYVSRGDEVRIQTVEGLKLTYTLRPDGSSPLVQPGSVTLAARPDARAVSATLCTPTAMQWRHPLLGLPAAMVVRAASVDGSAHGAEVMRTYLFQEHAPLSVISISTSHDGLFGEEDGICVVGNAMLHADAGILRSYTNDPRWWKYPGNYHGRGKEWEREALMQVIDERGREVHMGPVALRINGQMTRGFPQHALRLSFPEPLDTALFRDGDGKGTRALVLRAAGNDQVKAMLRDAYQHALCEGLPFGTSKARTSVVYINGAYQGVYHLRQRLDEDELARRYDIPKKRITILEDQSVLYHGDSADVRAFNSLMARTERSFDDPAWLDTLETRLDVDGFLTYMASQMILGNMDWPRQNVKYWRYTGKPKAAPLDGRWYFLMGDSDLGFGANAPVSADLFEKVRPAHVPVSRLFLAMMRAPAIKQRFVEHAYALIDGPLAPERCLAVLDSMVVRMDGEMERHTARWRKPANKQAWAAEVELMRGYAKQRTQHVRKQLDALK